MAIDFWLSPGRPWLLFLLCDGCKVTAGPRRSRSVHSTAALRQEHPLGLQGRSLVLPLGHQPGIAGRTAPGDARRNAAAAGAAAGVGRRAVRAVHGRASEPPLQMGQMHAAARPMLTTKRRRAPRRARHGQQVVRRGFSRSIEVLRARQPAPGRRVSTVVDVALDRGADDGIRHSRRPDAARPLHASYYWKGAGELRRDFEAPGPARRLSLLVRRRLGAASGGEGPSSPARGLGQPDAVPQPSESGPSMECPG